MLPERDWEKCVPRRETRNSEKQGRASNLTSCCSKNAEVLFLGPARLFAFQFLYVVFQGNNSKALFPSVPAVVFSFFAETMPLLHQLLFNVCRKWKRFCLQQHENRELCDVPEDEPNLLLCKFLKNVRKLEQLHFQHSAHLGAALPTKNATLIRSAQGSKRWPDVMNMSFSNG